MTTPDAVPIMRRLEFVVVLRRAALYDQEPTNLAAWLMKTVSMWLIH
jgi:hypothetical protein